MASHGDASRELFLGLLALEQELVDREQLVAAFETWKASPGRVMGEIMIEESRSVFNCGVRKS
jgi:hypothetical protein